MSNRRKPKDPAAQLLSGWVKDLHPYRPSRPRPTKTSNSGGRGGRSGGSGAPGNTVSWGNTANLPGPKQLERLRRRVDNDYVFSNFMNNLLFTKFRAMQDDYHDYLYETNRDGSPSGNTSSDNTANKSSSPVGNDSVYSNPVGDNSNAAKLLGSMQENLHSYKLTPEQKKAERKRTAFALTGTDQNIKNQFKLEDGRLLGQIGDNWYYATKTKNGQTMFVRAGADFADRLKNGKLAGNDAQYYLEKNGVLINPKATPEMLQKQAQEYAAEHDKSSKGGGATLIPNPIGRAWSVIGNQISNLEDKISGPLQTGANHVLGPLGAPLSGVAKVLMAESDMNNDHGKGSDVFRALAGNPFFEAVTGGQGPLDAVDEIVQHPSNITKLFKAFGSGVAEAAKGDHVTTTSEVIAHNAAKDPTKNRYDNKVYQALAGFAGDVAFDPLTYLGLPAGIKGETIAAQRGNTEAHALRNIADEDSEFFKRTKELSKTRVPKSLFDDSKYSDLVNKLDDSEHLTHPEIMDLLGGRLPKRFNNRADEVFHKEAVREAANIFDKHLSEYFPNKLRNSKPGKDFSKAQESLNSLLEQRKAQRSAVLSEGETDIVYDDLIREAEKSDLTGATANEVEDRITNINHHHLRRAFESDFKSNYDPENFSKFDEFMGPEWQADEAVPLADKQRIRSEIDKQLTSHPQTGAHVRAALDSITTARNARKSAEAKLNTKRAELKAEGKTSEQIAADPEIRRLNLTASKARKNHSIAQSNYDTMRAKAYAKALNAARLERATGQTKQIVDDSLEKNIDTFSDEIAAESSRAEAMSGTKTSLDSEADSIGESRLEMTDEELAAWKQRNPEAKFVPGTKSINLKDADLSDPLTRRELIDQALSERDPAVGLARLSDAVERFRNTNRHALSDFNYRNLTAPDIVKTEGKIDQSKVKHFIAQDAGGHFYVQRNRIAERFGADSEEARSLYSYLDNVVNDINSRTARAADKQIRKAGGDKSVTDKRREQEDIREAAKSDVVASKIDALQNERLTEAQTRDKHTPARIAAAKRLGDSYVPYGEGYKKHTFRITGKDGDVFYADKNLKTSLEEAGFPVTARDTTKAKRVRETLQTVRAGMDDTKNTKAIHEAAEYLRDLGYSVAEKPSLIRAWMKSLGADEKAIQTDSAIGINHAKTVEELIDQISPERATFMRAFKAEHNRPLGEAFDDVKIAVGNQGSALRANYGQWFNTFGGAMGKSEFIQRATTSPEEMFRTLYRAPFAVLRSENGLTPKEYISEFGTKSEKNLIAQSQQDIRDGLSKTKAITAYNNISKKYTEKFVQDFWKLIRKDPDEAWRLLDKGWSEYAEKAAKGHQTFERSLEHHQVIAQSALDEAAVKKQAAHYQSQVDPEAITQAVRESKFAEVMNDLEHVQYLPDEPYSIRTSIKSNTDAKSETKAMHDAVVEPKRERVTELKQERRETPASDREGVARLDAQIRDAEAEVKAAERRFKNSLRRAKSARRSLAKFLQEEAVMKVMRDVQYKPEMPGIKLHALFSDFVYQLPDTPAVRNAMAAANSNKMIDLAKEAWKHSIAPPIQSLPRDLQIHALRATANTAGVIRERLDQVREDFADILPKEAKRSFDAASISGKSDNPLPGQNAFVDHFDDLAKTFRGDNPDAVVNGIKVTVDDIMRWMPTEYQFTNAAKKSSFRNGIDLMRIFKHQLKNAPKGSKQAAKLDPLHALWSTRIAVENAIAQKMLTENVNEMFGIKLAAKNVKNQPKTYVEEAVDYGVHELERLGWKQIPELGDTHIFPPELVQPLTQLSKTLDPRHMNTLGKFIDTVAGRTKFDQITHGWKASATIYNPGYYTRNLVGEVMAGWFGGLNNPVFYDQARRVLKLADPETPEMQQVLNHAPWASYVKQGRSTDRRVIVTRPNGDKLTEGEALILYHDQGLKTSFVNQTFRERMNQSKVRTTSRTLGKPAVKVHDFARAQGEYYEDLPRMAHFIFALKNAPKHMSIEKAAEWASQEVRKYHFDYSDVSQFEQTVMARVFPFFKWTRKALPLFAEMLWVKPGKVALYPKAMNAISQVSTGDMQGSFASGYIPTYESMVPGFIRDQWSYPLGTDKHGHDTYGNLTTPQMDVLKFFSNPIESGAGMLNPLIRTPIEAGAGHVMDPDLKGLEINGWGGVAQQAGRSIPAVGFGEDVAKGNVTVTGAQSEKFWKFLTGLGLYQDNIHVRTASDYSKFKKFVEDNMYHGSMNAEQKERLNEQVDNMMENQTGFRNTTELDNFLDRISGKSAENTDPGAPKVVD